MTQAAGTLLGSKPSCSHFLLSSLAPLSFYLRSNISLFFPTKLQILFKKDGKEMFYLGLSLLSPRSLPWSFSMSRFHGRTDFWGHYKGDGGKGNTPKELLWQAVSL